MAAIVLASCNYVQWEAPSYHFNVWNYSMNQYFVVATADDGSFYTMAVGPYAVVVGSAGSPFKKASVYDENCTTDLADVVIPSGATEIVISASGAISVSTKEFVRPGPSDPQIIDALPVPSGCLRYWETGTQPATLIGALGTKRRRMVAVREGPGDLRDRMDWISVARRGRPSVRGHEKVPAGGHGSPHPRTDLGHRESPGERR